MHCTNPDTVSLRRLICSEIEVSQGRQLDCEPIVYTHHRGWAG